MKGIKQLVKDYEGHEKVKLRAILRGVIQLRQSACLSAEMGREVDSKWLIGKLEKIILAKT